MPLQKLYIECLVLTQSFEIIWLQYFQSDGNLLSNQCREAALAFLGAFDEARLLDSDLKNPAILEIEPPAELENVLSTFRGWATGSALFPYQTAHESRFMLFHLLGKLKMYFVKKLDLTRSPLMVMNTADYTFTLSSLKWKAHLPFNMLSKNPDALIKAACQTPTVVVVGDIRRSQDLMTYATSAEDFSERLIAFLSNTRELIERYGGIFDKFTGDGFIAYFNESICKINQPVQLNHTDNFLRFIQAYDLFAESHFSEWARRVKKAPGEPVGVAIGADLGVVSFQNINNHFVAVGDTIVWAARMVAEAKAAEVVVNNRLYEALRERPNLTFVSRPRQKPNLMNHFWQGR